MYNWQNKIIFIVNLFNVLPDFFLYIFNLSELQSQKEFANVGCSFHINSDFTFNFKKFKLKLI
jgi:hypothetical protein